MSERKVRAIETIQVSENLQSSTYGLLGPDLTKYTVSVYEAKTEDGILGSVKANGLSLEDLNDAMRVARKQFALSALESNPDTKIAEAVKHMMSLLNLSQEDARKIAEGQRAAISTGLPDGVSVVKDEQGNTVKGKRKGRAPAVK